jgi:hypothetical protein
MSCLSRWILSALMLVVAGGCGGADESSGETDEVGVRSDPATGDYLLISQSALMALPTSGDAWTRLKAHADASWPTPSLVDQDRKHGTYVLAAALVYARTGVAGYRDRARNGIMAVIGTEDDPDTRTLSVGRQLGSYVLAADFIGLSGTDDATFRSWLSAIRTRVFPAHGRWTTLKICHEDASNNWGGWCGASLVAASLYLGDTTDVAQRVRVVKGFLGDRTQWNDFRGQDEKNGVLGADEKSWSCDSSASAWVPLNPPCTKSGIDLDGAIPSDASRGGPLTWPVPSTGVSYTCEVMQGLLIQLELLYQAGYDLWTYQNHAIERAGDFLHRTNGWNHSSISYGNAWLANYRLGTTYPKKTPGYSRMLIGYDWLWGGAAAPAPDPEDPPPTGDTTVVFTPVADAYVDEAAPSSNFGTKTLLLTDQGPTQQAYLRFDVSGVAGAVKSAKLRIYATNGSTNGPAVSTTSAQWSELAITWSNRPSPQTLLGDKGSVASSTWVEYDVLSAVAASGSYGFVVVPTSSDGFDFQSRENTNKPQLVVVFGS